MFSKHLTFLISVASIVMFFVYTNNVFADYDIQGLLRGIFPTSEYKEKALGNTSKSTAKKTTTDCDPLDPLCPSANPTLEGEEGSLGDIANNANSSKSGLKDCTDQYGQPNPELGPNEGCQASEAEIERRRAEAEAKAAQNQKPPEQPKPPKEPPKLPEFPKGGGDEKGKDEKGGAKPEEGMEQKGDAEKIKGRCKKKSGDEGEDCKDDKAFVAKAEDISTAGTAFWHDFFITKAFAKAIYGVRHETEPPSSGQRSVDKNNRKPITDGYKYAYKQLQTKKKNGKTQKVGKGYVTEVHFDDGAAKWQ